VGRFVPFAGDLGGLQPVQHRQDGGHRLVGQVLLTRNDGAPVPHEQERGGIQHCRVRPSLVLELPRDLQAQGKELFFFLGVNEGRGVGAVLIAELVPRLKAMWRLLCRRVPWLPMGHNFAPRTGEVIF